MSIEQNNEPKIEKGPEIKWGGPKSLDGVTGRLVAAGLILYESLRHTRSSGTLTIDFARRIVSTERWNDGGGGIGVREVYKQNG